MPALLPSKPGAENTQHLVVFAQLVFLPHDEGCDAVVGHSLRTTKTAPVYQPELSKEEKPNISALCISILPIKQTPPTFQTKRVLHPGVLPFFLERYAGVSSPSGIPRSVPIESCSR
ncbi:hypothetical protein GN956_G25196 [Arapaima gigas]